MKRILKLFLLMILIVVIAIAALIVKILLDSRRQAEDQQKMVKTDDELIGTHFYMSRADREDVDMNLYLLDDGETHPLVINVHGGAFIAGDADTLDTQSDRISKAWNVCVATVNYKLAKNGYDIPYGTQEIVDTVKYFIQNAEKYHIDRDKIYIMGYSAGGYHAMAAVLRLYKEGISLTGQIICYGFLRDVMELYGELSEEQRAALPSSLFIIAQGDPIGEGSLTYEQALRDSGVSTQVKTYSGAMHGFLEENNPEYEKLHSHASMSPEQEAMARDAENYIGRWIGGGGKI